MEDEAPYAVAHLVIDWRKFVAGWLLLISAGHDGLRMRRYCEYGLHNANALCQTCCQLVMSLNVDSP